MDLSKKLELKIMTCRVNLALDLSLRLLLVTCAWTCELETFWDLRSRLLQLIHDKSKLEKEKKTEKISHYEGE